MTPPTLTGPAAVAGAPPGARRAPAPQLPRRRSVPARPVRPAGARRRGLGRRLGHAGMRVGDARLLDRLVRGRAWIGIVAALLLGIVFLQVSLLKLNAGISRAVTSADTLDRENSTLRADISELESGERIQAVAAKLGMAMPAAGSVHFLDARGADATRAANAIRPPNPVAAASVVAPATQTSTGVAGTTASAAGTTPAATTATDGTSTTTGAIVSPTTTVAPTATAATTTTAAATAAAQGSGG
jgi:cell division protein FtsL